MKILAAILCLLSLPVIAGDLSTIIGSYEGGGRMGSEDCSIVIKEVKPGLISFTVSFDKESLTSPLIKKSLINSAMASSQYNDFSYNKSKNLDFRRVEKWHINASNFDMKRHEQNAGFLNFVRVKHSIEDRWCLGWGCASEGKDLSCPVKIEL